MTSEIAVMNQRAVALAADSAVTLIDGGMVVVRNDQRKLYNLAEGLPVGVMFFGVADMMGHPWEHLIEHFQDKAGGKLAHLRDYAVKFTGMLDNLDEFFPRERQKDDYRRLLASVFRYVFHLAQYMRDSGGDYAKLPDAQLLEKAIERVWHDYQFNADGTQRRDLPCFPKGFTEIVERDYSDAMEELVTYGFSSFAIDRTAMLHLREISLFCVVKDLFLEDVTGLVFAGFGGSERYPVVSTWFLSAIVGGIVKRVEASLDAIDGETRSKIRVFADSEVTNAFLRGIDFNLERRFYGGMQVMMSGMIDHLVGSFTRVDPAEREGVRRQFQAQYLPQYVDAFRSMMGDYQQQAYINPVLRVLEIAAKPELAETARELVALNVFKKRIMAQHQTVGGAIDVAVISRESGFQWWTKQGGG
jgi:hypothetical protein